MGGARAEVGGVREDVGGATSLAEDEDGIPAIKSSHLDLDDIPMELLPIHQEKIMKQVCIIVYRTIVVYIVQLNPSTPDTNETKESVYISDMSLLKPCGSVNVSYITRFSYFRLERGSYTRQLVD